MANKYNARKVEYDGFKFDSAAEMRRYIWLKDEQEQGNIQLLKVHVPFEIVPKSAHWVARLQIYREINRVMHEVDFSYLDNLGYQVVEDVKGVETDLWKLKYKLFCSRYPQIDYRVIPAKDC